jgi:hypothetical protein
VSQPAFTSNGPASAPRSFRARDVAAWLAQWCLWWLLFVFLTLVAALVAATVLGRWAWIPGAVIGAIARCLPVARDPKSHPPWLPTRIPDAPMSSEPVHRPLWVTRDGIRQGFGGLVFGVILGFFLAASWFSISVSPFAPAAWEHSVTPVAPGGDAGPRDAGETRLGGLTTQHPLLFALFLGPPAALWLLGFVLGGFGRHWVEIGSHRETKA